MLIIFLEICISPFTKAPTQFCGLLNTMSRYILQTEGTRHKTAFCLPFYPRQSLRWTLFPRVCWDALESMWSVIRRYQNYADSISPLRLYWPRRRFISQSFWVAYLLPTVKLLLLFPVALCPLGTYIGVTSVALSSVSLLSLTWLVRLSIMRRLLSRFRLIPALNLLGVGWRELYYRWRHCSGHSSPSDVITWLTVRRCFFFLLTLSPSLSFFLLGSVSGVPRW
jgi:hypothetical protein